MKRIEAIKEIMDEVLDDDIVITSAGMISREVYCYKDRPRNFYVMGSMGSSLGIGIGIALNKSDSNIIVIAGDGEILMSLGTLVLMNKLLLRNLTLFIIDNHCYSSTGGQPTCSDAVSFGDIANCEVIEVEPDKGDVPRIDMTPKEIEERFYDEING